jgi:radical SAM superfamily enzyme YgiQ (UPF0313 family)
MEMKIALIFPPYFKKIYYHSPPLGLAYLASSLENEGHKVKIIDAGILNLSYQDVLKRLKQFDPELIGITSQTVFLHQIKSMSDLIKKEFPEIPLICGGPHATILPEQTLKDTCVDIVAVGEGEHTVTELADTIERNKTLESVKGLVFKSKSKSGRIIFTGAREPIEDLDSIPFPARHLLPSLIKYCLWDVRAKRFPSTSAITSRGCPYNCLFCTVRTIWGRKFRQRSVKNVIEEIYELIDKFKVKEINWDDDTFTLNKKWILEFCREILREKLDITWKCLARVDGVDDETLSLMKKAGCHALSFGVESGNQEVLNKIRKNITLSQVEHAFKLAKRYGFETQAFFMFGNHGDNYSTIIDTINFAKKLNPDYITNSIATPFPGSEFYAIARKKGLIEEEDWTRMDYFSNAIIRTEDLTPEDLMELRDKAYAAVYGDWNYFRSNIMLKLKECNPLNPLDLRRIFYKVILFTLNGIFPKVIFAHR